MGSPLVTEVLEDEVVSLMTLCTVSARSRQTLDTAIGMLAEDGKHCMETKMGKHGGR